MGSEKGTDLAEEIQAEYWEVSAKEGYYLFIFLF